jgi:carbon-monoxide dehydrogenase medium subunit
MSELKAFYQPRSLSEAIALLEEHGDRARPLAGGTALSRSRSPRIEVLVDLGRLKLDRIEERDDGLHIGAMVTCAALLRHLRGRPPGLLSEAAASIGSRILQNQVTVGGNCVMVYAWSDLPVALWCAEARFLVHGRQSRELGADAFFAEHPSRMLGSEEILTEVVVPAPPPGTGSAYLKLGRNSTDHGLAAAAVQVTLAAGRIVAARVAAGGVRGLPQLLPVTGLLGQTPEPSRLLEAARRAAEEARVTGDYRASVEYRRQVLFSLVADGLALAIRRAGGAS